MSMRIGKMLSDKVLAPVHFVQKFYMDYFTTESKPVR
jgi:hypothetical protein